MSGMIHIPYGHGFVTRPAPVMSPHMYKTYAMNFPRQTHWRPATCEEVECSAYLLGWSTTLDENTPEGQYHAETIKSLRGYKYTVEQQPSGLTVYHFPAGQKCFRASQHRVRLERLPHFLVVPGDFRQKTGPTRVHTRPEDWVEDFALHQQKIADAIQEG